MVAAAMDLAVLKKFFEESIPFNRFLGMEVALVEPGRARLEVPFREELIGDALRPAIHGGVISTLADTAGGMAVWSMLESLSMRISTIDLRIDYLRPGKPERLAAEAVIVRIGKTVGVADIRVFQPSAEAETVAMGKGVYSIKVPRHARV
jgi:uncharacterized protein (TIGR00369 family)